ncbi:MAG TPA: CRISPR-associated endonuclease Cas2 [Calditrichaeota bacterium]|nr:CRISPR-associated endonuclease Cas2 [Calditrichota bacterium]
MEKKKWLIIYDIRHPKRLQKIANLMTGYAVRVQKSVFELAAGDAVITEIRGKARRILDEEKDFVVYFNICEKDWQKRIKYGPQKFEEEEEQPYHIY